MERENFNPVADQSNEAQRLQGENVALKAALSALLNHQDEIVRFNARVVVGIFLGKTGGIETQ